MAKKVTVAPPPKLDGIPRVDFLNPDFDTLIWNKGYDILLEKAIPCPCSKKVQHPQSACRNCLGTGWLYVHREKTKAVIQSINKETKYKDWSQELIGTVNITVENRFQLSFRDRITILDSVSIGVEVQIVRGIEGQLFLYTIYPIEEIQYIYKFVDNETQLLQLDLDDYIFSDNVIKFSSNNVEEGDSISIRYKHKIAYSIIDINHDIRNSYQLNNSSREVQNRLPVSAVARKLQYLIDQRDINNNTIFENDSR